MLWSVSLLNITCHSSVVHYLSLKNQKLKSVFSLQPCCHFTFHTHTNVTVTEFTYFSKICCHTSFQAFILNVSSITPDSTALSVYHVLVTDCRKWKIKHWSGFQWHSVHTKFHESQIVNLKICGHRKNDDLMSLPSFLKKRIKFALI
jgi:hypothetical protein